MAEAGTISFKLLGDTAQFKKALAGAQASLERFGEQSKQMAMKAGVAFAGLTLTGKKLIDLAREQENSEIKLAAAFRATGQAVDMERMKAYASSLQNVTTFGDEATLGAGALLATFNLTQDQLEQLLPLTQDVAAMMGTDLKSAAMQVGRALTQGAGALSRLGITMTEAQKEAYNLADAEEKVALLAEVLAQNVGGTAKALRQSAFGAIDAMNNSLGDLGEQFGKTIAEGLRPFSETMILVFGAVEGYLKSMSPEAKKTAANVMLVATALTGAATAVGAMGAALPSLVAGLKAVALMGGKVAAVLLPIISGAGIIGIIKDMATEGIGATRQKMGISNEAGFGDILKIVAVDSVKRGLEPIGDLVNGIMDSIGVKIEEGTSGPDGAATNLKKVGKAASVAAKNIEIDFSAFAEVLDKQLAEEGFRPFMESVSLAAKQMQVLADDSEKWAKKQEAAKDAEEAATKAATQSILSQFGPSGQIVSAIRNFSDPLSFGAEIFGVLVSELEIFKTIIGVVNGLFNGMAGVINTFTNPVVSVANKLFGLGDSAEHASEVMRNFGQEVDETLLNRLRSVALVGATAVEGGMSVDEMMAQVLADLGGGASNPAVQAALKKLYDDLQSELALIQLGGASDPWRTAELVGGELEVIAGLLGDGSDTLKDTVDKMNEELTNVPQGFKVALERFRAIEGDALAVNDAMVASSAGGGGATGGGGDSWTSPIVGAVSVLGDRIAAMLEGHAIVTTEATNGVREVLVEVANMTPEEREAAANDAVQTSVTNANAYGSGVGGMFSW